MLKIILAIGGIQVAAILIGIVRSKLVALLLGPAGVGVVSVIDQVVQLVAYLSAFSLPMAAVRYLSRAHSDGEERFRRAYGAFLRAILALSTTGTLIALALVALRPQWLGSEIQGLRPYLFIAVLAVPSMIISGFIPNVLAAAQKVRTSATLGILTNGGLTIAAVAGILLAGVAGMYVGTVTVLALMAFVGLLYLKARLKLPLFDGTTHVLAELRANRGVISFSAIFSLAAVASSLALLVMRQAVLGAGGAATAGLLQSAYALALAINMVLNPTNGLYLTPIMNRNIAEAEKLQTALEYQTRLAAILVVVSLPLVLFPKTALYVLFSGRFVSAAEWVFLFVTAQVVLQFAGIYQAILIGLNAMRAYAVVTVGGHVVTGLAAWFLVPLWGIGGAGLALLAGATFSAAAGLAVLKIRQGLALSPERFAIVAYGVAVCLAVGLVARGLPEWTWQAMLGRALAYAVAAAAALLFLSARDRAGLLELVSRRVRPA